MRQGGMETFERSTALPFPREDVFGWFAHTLGRVLSRPSRIPVPAFGPRLLLGAEGAGELAAADQLVTPAALERAGFRFRRSSLEAQLRHVLGR